MTKLGDAAKILKVKPMHTRKSSVFNILNTCLVPPRDKDNRHGHDISIPQWAKMNFTLNSKAWNKI